MIKMQAISFLDRIPGFIYKGIVTTQVDRLKAEDLSRCNKSNILIFVNQDFLIKAGQGDFRCH